MATSAEAIDRAIKIAGGLTALGRKLGGVTTATVWQWQHRGKPALRFCPAIERETGVRCEELRPDVDWSGLRQSK